MPSHLMETPGNTVLISQLQTICGIVGLCKDDYARLLFAPMGSRQLPAAGQFSIFGLTPPSHAIGLMDIVSTPAPMPMV